MRYKILHQAKARDVLDCIDPPVDERPTLIGYESIVGTGEMLEFTVFEQLGRRLLELKDRCGDDTQQFDAIACVLVHQLVPDEPELLRDDGFWRWLALGPLQKIVLWRFPAGKRRDSESEEALPKLNRQNFGVGASARQRAECYPYKLWLRAELGLAPGEENAYRYATRGDVDFWTSHILRQSYTTNRSLCAALVRFQYPDELEGRPRLVPGTENVEGRRFGIRTLAKRIRRLQATSELSVLSDIELDSLVSELAQDLTRAN